MKLPKWIIELTGHTMIHNRFPWIVYKPDIHKVRGEHVRQVLGEVEAGDILLRRFDGYLNTLCTPGYWGHAGVYVGDNQIVHAVGKGVISEDILNFCRCDAICVLAISPHNRFMPYASMARDAAVKKAQIIAAKKALYDFDFEAGNEKYYCTELIDQIYNGIFYADYEKIAGHYILTPDGIRHSNQVREKLEIKP